MTFGSALKVSLSGKGLSEEDRQKLSTLQEENNKYQTELKELQDKLHKAKAFIKQQDKLFKEAHAAANDVSSFSSLIRLLH